MVPWNTNNLELSKRWPVYPQDQCAFPRSHLRMELSYHSITHWLPLQHELMENIHRVHLVWNFIRPIRSGYIDHRTSSQEATLPLPEYIRSFGDDDAGKQCAVFRQRLEDIQEMMNVLCGWILACHDNEGQLLAIPMLAGQLQ